MGRKHDLIDVMAAIGLVATLVGGYAVVMATNGFWQQTESIAIASPTPVGIEAGIQWLQPAIGQAMLDEELLGRQTARTLASSFAELKRAQNAQQRLEDLTFSPLGVVEIGAATMEADHAARMQWVMGHSIINGTRQGIRAGILSADQHVSNFNRDLIRTAELNGDRMHRAFEDTHQAYLGQSIVQAALDEDQQMSSNQERIGHALLRVALAEEAYGEASGLNQYQLATAAMAAVRANDAYGAMGGGGAGELVAEVEPRLWQDIPGRYVAAAFAGLVAVFWGGMAMAARRREEEALAIEKVETLQRLYRMTG